MCVQCIHSPHACMYVCVHVQSGYGCMHACRYVFKVRMYVWWVEVGGDRQVCVYYIYYVCVHNVCMYMYHQLLIQNRTFLRLRLGDVFASSDSACGVGEIVRFKVSLGVWRVSFGLRLYLCGSKTPNQLPPYWLLLMLP